MIAKIGVPILALLVLGSASAAYLAQSASLSPEAVYVANPPFSPRFSVVLGNATLAEAPSSGDFATSPAADPTEGSAQSPEVGTAGAPGAPGATDQQNQAQDSPQIYYPAYAEIVIYDNNATATEWQVVKDDGKIVVANGVGAFIGGSAFSALGVGNYTISWIVVGDTGQTGTASHTFQILASAA